MIFLIIKNIFFYPNVKENRVNCCKSYTDCFNDKKYDELERASAEPSLFSLVCHWLESIPTLKDNIVWDQYRRAADHWLERSTEVCFNNNTNIGGSVWLGACD